MTAEVYSLRFEVPESAIDLRNHVNNLKYLEWCLQAAEEHWVQNASPQMLEAYIWYVLHHSIDYKASAFVGDPIEVQTWVESNEGVKSVRHYRIIRTNDNTELARAKTIWCLLKANDQRPIKIPEEIRNLF